MSGCLKQRAAARLHALLQVRLPRSTAPRSRAPPARRLRVRCACHRAFACGRHAQSGVTHVSAVARSVQVRRSSRPPPTRSPQQALCLRLAQQRGAAARSSRPPGAATAAVTAEAPAPQLPVCGPTGASEAAVVAVAVAAVLHGALQRRQRRLPQHMSVPAVQLSTRGAVSATRHRRRRGFLRLRLRRLRAGRCCRRLVGNGRQGRERGQATVAATHARLAGRIQAAQCTCRGRTAAGRISQDCRRKVVRTVCGGRLPRRSRRACCTSRTAARLRTRT